MHTGNRIRLCTLGLAAAAVAMLSGQVVLGHGDVTPQPIDTSALPDVGEDWLTLNPYRDMGPEVWATAIEIGASGYNQNCARCHGLGAVSGGLAPDLRFLEAADYGDEWFVERFRHGYTQDGVTKMPAFEGLLDQKAAWAIRTYIETRPDDAAMDEIAGRLKEIRDALAAGTGDVAALKAELSAIAETLPTLSGAPVADSIARQAALALDGTEGSWKKAAEALTVGLSAAH